MKKKLFLTLQGKHKGGNSSFFNVKGLHFKDNRKHLCKLQVIFLLKSKMTAGHNQKMHFTSESYSMVNNETVLLLTYTKNYTVGLYKLDR